MKALLGLILTAFTLSVLAQSGSISGTVYVSDQSTPLPFATVFLEGSQIGTTSDKNGEFLLEEVPVGKHTLVVSSIGYQTNSIEIVLTEGEHRSNLEVEMNESITSIPQVIISSQSLTGGRKGLQDLPGSAYFMSEEEIQQFKYTDINRSLRNVPGVNIQEEDGFGLRPNIGLRATGVERSSKITLMEDGVLIAPAPYTAPAAYYFPTFGRMQSLEILKGASQIKYGPYTTGGALNLISTAIPEEFGGRVSIIGGSYGAVNAHAFIGNSHEHVGYMVEGFQYRANGFKDLDGGGNTGFNKQDLVAKLQFNSKEDAKVYQALSLKYGKAVETSHETYLGLTDADFKDTPYRRYAGSQEDLMETNHSQYTANYFIGFSEKVELNTTIYRTDFHRNWYKLDKVIDSSGSSVGISDLLADPKNYQEAYDIVVGGNSRADALQVKANNRDYYGQGIQSTLGMRFSSGLLSHSLEIGIRFHEDALDRFQWVDGYSMDNGIMKLTTAGQPGTESNRIHKARAFAGYTQYQIKFDKLTVTPGLRYEYIAMSRKDFGKNDPDRTGQDLKVQSNSVSVLIPGISVDYKFTREIRAFAGVHKGFAPPGSTEGTNPESSINFELGFVYESPDAKIQAVGFYSDYKNLLGSDLSAGGGGGTNALFNGGEAFAAGLEFLGTYDLISMAQSNMRLPLTFSYTFTQARFLSDFDSDYEAWGAVEYRDELPYLAHNQFALSLSLEHAKFNLNVSGKYTGQMRTAPGKGEPLPQGGIGAYFTLDVSANYHAHKHIDFFLSATNLTNNVYAVSRRPAGLRPGMPIAILAGLTANF